MNFLTAAPRGPKPKPQEQMSPREARKAAKALARETEEAVEALVEAHRARDTALGRVQVLMGRLQAARQAADDLGAPGMRLDVLLTLWRIRDGEHGQLELRGRAVDGSLQPRERHIAEVTRHAELPVKAIEALAEYLGRGANDGQLHAIRMDRRRKDARAMIVRELIHAAAAGEELTDGELVQHAIARAYPGFRRRR